MKIKWIVLLTACILLLTACAAQENLGEWAGIPYDESGMYSGFADLPQGGYTAESAEQDGCFVKDSTAEDRGQDFWEAFLASSRAGDAAKVRIVSVYEGATYVTDLYYDGEAYHAFYDEAPEREICYKYLLILNGKMESWQEEQSVVLLANDPNLTYKDYMWALISSQSSDWVDAALLFFDFS